MTGRTSSTMTTRRLRATLSDWLRPASLTPAEIAALQGAAAPTTAGTPGASRPSALGRWFQPTSLTPEETAAVVGGWYGASRRDVE